MDSESVLEAIAAGEWEGPLRFAARQQFVNALSRWHQASGGMPTLLGARIYPVPHQLYAVRKVLADEWPRHLLADEVGLGKTIEAGLVIQAMRGFHGQLRILVAAPGATAPKSPSRPRAFAPPQVPARQASRAPGHASKLSPRNL